MRTFLRRRFGALVPIIIAAACGGGGGGGGGGIAFSLAGLVPAVSNDLGGDELVTITGTNFISAGVAGVTFGGEPATDRQVISETEMTVRTPAAPGGVPQTVTVVVTTVYAGSKQFTDGYTYAASGPDPQSISPTTFTPTGAEDFTITGTALGPLGGQVSVVFQGVGTVTGAVSLDGQTITGRAPVSAGVPLAGPITVTVDTGASTADVAVPVAYPFTAPVAIGQISQSPPGSASQPVRFADGFAAFCTAGADSTWGNADDEIRILRGPPSGILTTNVPPRGGAPATPVGYLNQFNSIPAILGQDTFAVYTNGAPGPAGPVPGVLLVTLARTTPVADFHLIPSLNAAPISAIGPNRIAATRIGIALGGGDELFIQDYNLASVPTAPAIPVRVPIGTADLTAGPLNFSIPSTADGDTVFAMSVGPNGTPRDQDDLLYIRVVSTATTSPVAAPYLLGPPLAISPTLVAAPGAGANLVFGGGTADDTLEVISFAGAWTPSTKPLNRALNLAALAPYARCGNGVAVAVTGPTAITVFTNPVAGTNTTMSFAGNPVFASLPNAGLAAFGPGQNLVPATGGDDQAMLIDPLAASQSFSHIPNFPQTLVPLTDADRAFALSPGGDALFGTIDDILEVYQSRAAGATTSASRLPAAALPLAPLVASGTFVPIGPGWGVAQSPGVDGTYRNFDDAFVILRY